MINVFDRYVTLCTDGVMRGVPVAFVRLAGCDLFCPWCDVPGAWSPGRGMALDERALAAELRALNPRIDHALVTGGEPCLQDLDALSHALRDAYYYAMLETCGAYPLSGLWDYLIVSPILDRPLQSRIIERADEVRFVVCGKTSLDRFAAEIAPRADQRATITLTPRSRNRELEDLCSEACIERGWRLSVQASRTRRVYPAFCRTDPQSAV